MVKVWDANHVATIRNMVGADVNIRHKDHANRIHNEVGRKVPRTIHELGGTMPENLPVAESIKKVEGREMKRLKTGRTANLANHANGLKARQMIAQGNALGLRSKNNSSPERATESFPNEPGFASLR
jgi:hypothetical protein